MEIKKSNLMFVIHHFVRPVWALYLFKCISFILTIIKQLNKKYRNNVYIHKNLWKNCTTSQTVSNFFKVNFEYIWDDLDNSKRGLFDHDSSMLEFYTGNGSKAGGDCDISDIVSKKINSIKVKSKRVGIISGEKNKLSSWHYDCLFNGNRLFNFGYVINGENEKNTFENLNTSWSNFFSNKILYWNCYKPLEYIGGFITGSILISSLSIIIILITKAVIGCH